MNLHNLDVEYTMFVPRQDNWQSINKLAKPNSEDLYILLRSTKRLIKYKIDLDFYPYLKQEFEIALDSTKMP